MEVSMELKTFAGAWSHEDGHTTITLEYPKDIGKLYSVIQNDESFVLKHDESDGIHVHEFVEGSELLAQLKSGILTLRAIME